VPREFSRGKRVADLIQQQLARLIQTELKDPRIGMVTVNEVKVSRDLAFADIYFTMLGKEDPDEATEALTHAAGFLRSRLAKVLTTRTTPRLRFHYDETIENGATISKAISKAIESDRKHPGYEDE
jgi:ribosome-binding factor A